MSSDFPETLPVAEARPAQELITEKYKACWGLSIDCYGGNINAMADLLYKALYNPEFFREKTEFASESFPQRIVTLTSQAPVGPVPAEKDFTEALSRAVRRDVDYKACLFDGAVEQVDKLARQGQVVVWTSGDTLGVGEFEGSLIQHTKVLDAGLNELRSQVASESGRKRMEVLSIMASTDKLTDAAVTEMAIKALGKQPIVVIDDRLDNLAAIREKMAGVVPIWVRQDKHGREIPEQLKGVNEEDLRIGFNAIDGIQELSEKVRDLIGDQPELSPVFFIDYDGTLSNDTERAQLQEQAVMKTLRDKGWV